MGFLLWVWLLVAPGVILYAEHQRTLSRVRTTGDTTGGSTRASANVAEQ